jgi:peptidoglycan/xylan/chitin deacetylase (PgdA/CDA1 family)
MCSQHLAKRAVRMDNPAPLVSFTFDDFPRSALLKGGEILRNWGASGTFYLSFGLEGRTAETGKIVERDDLCRLLSQGHELGCHTFAHCDAGLTSADSYEQSIRLNRRSLQSLFPGAEFRTHSFPISTPNLGVKRIAAKHFQGCRGGGQTYNSGFVDLNFLRSFFLEQSLERPDEILRRVTENARDRGWLIFATHDVSEQPTRYGCTPALLEWLINACLESGAQILTVTRALDSILGTAKAPQLNKTGCLQ